MFFRHRIIMKKNLQNETGATLIDLIFSTAIMLFVTASFYHLLLSFYENYGLQEAIAEMQQQARVADDLISREIRLAGYDPTGALFLENQQPNGSKTTKEYSKSACKPGPHPAEQIFEATPALFHYLADLNGNAAVNLNKDIDEDVRYEWVGAGGRDFCGKKKSSFTLYRDSGSGGGAQEVALNIENFNLAYFDENGNELIGTLPQRALDLEQRGKVKKVVITFTVKAALNHPHGGANQRHGSRTRVTEVWLKNR